MSNEEKNLFERLSEELEKVKKSCEEFGGDLNDKAKEAIKKLLDEYNETERKDNEEFTSLEDEFAKLKESIKEQAKQATQEFKKFSEQFKNMGKSFVFSKGSQSQQDKNATSNVPLYEVHKDGFVTKVWADGRKEVTSKNCDDKKKNINIVINADDKNDKEKKRNTRTYADRIISMLPHLDEDSIHELVEKIVNDEIEIDMSEVLDYLDEEDIKLLLDKIIESGGKHYKNLTLEEILPYADEEDISRVFIEKAKKGIIDEDLLDYVDEDCLHQVVVDYCNDENSELDIDCIYPHLDEDDLKLLFSSYLKRRK